MAETQALKSDCSSLALTLTSWVTVGKLPVGKHQAPFLYLSHSVVTALTSCSCGEMG